MKTIVAGIQFKPEAGTPQRNLDVSVQLAFQASLHGAKLVVFPELSMSNYFLESQQDAFRYAQEKNGYQTKAFHEVARTFNSYIAFGYVELSEGNLFNSAAIVGPSGLVANVRKCNIEGSDYLWATASSDFNFPVVLTPFGRLGVLVNHDIANCKESGKNNQIIPEFYRRGDIDTVALVGSYVNEIPISVPNTDLMRFVENVECNIVVGARVGKEKTVNFNGGAIVIERSLNFWNEGSKFDDDSLIVGGKLLT